MPYFGPMPDFSVAAWRGTIAGELDIPFFVSKYAWPHLVRRGGGVIINVASMAGTIAGAVPPMTAHSAANAVLTPASDRDLGDDQAMRDAITGKTLLKRFARPEEIVELAAFLASDRATYITGANYAVDGGASAW